ncbi:MAG: thymidine phosphorylase, partial [Candidatus Onthomonas sp.]|nr:thymidine phosphorylase [Candidatus Onthomonas sp.]
MNDREISVLTDAMAHSGDMIDLSRFGTLSADKHSTGGVGDKTSLIVMPIVAALGAKVAKMTGRGLGHTGGTVDKLESIPGYQIALDSERFLTQVEDIGISLVGQSGNLTPADKKLYALRDVTATVNSIPLITSSIMSKKLAAGAHNIVLDVKVGSGAFMKTPADGRALAVKMVSIGKLCGRNMTAVLTNMDAPLGHNIGNALEVREAVAVLKGESRGDLREVCIALASNLIRMVFDLTEEEARRRVIDALGSGAAFSKLKEWISAQGGDTRCLDDPSLFPATAFAYEIQSPVNGYIRKMDAERIGITSVMLGAGRETKDAPIDYSAGIVLCKKVGERVSAGETLATLYTNRESALAEAAEHYLTALTFGETPPEPQPLIYEIVR